MSDKLAGPELGKAALEAMGRKVGGKDQFGNTWVEPAVGGKWQCDPHINADDAIALLEEWAKGGDQKDDRRYWGCVYFGSGARVLYECRLSWSEYWVGQGNTLEEAICRALVAWGKEGK